MSTQTCSCPCGSTELTITAEPLLQFHCHCDDCQRVSNGAYVSVALFPKAAVTVSKGQAQTWTYKALPRSRCSECGCLLYGDAPGQAVRGVYAGLLPDGFQAQFHIQCQYARLPIKDDLPHYQAFPAQFGGSDATVDW